MEDVSINVCAESAFVYTTDDLLKNLTFSSGKCAPFKLHHYAILKHLSNGIVDKIIVDDSVNELKKFNFKIDSKKRYITNVLDFELIVLDHDLSTVHVINAETRVKLGHLNVSLHQNDPNALIISATL
ncbi:hypothetical protein [Condylorrhiza vestigialis mutiple nucleopolyhedrovirus]|uniref:Uncharacterized protein n=1 Tax=Condylorrhiza vestigialis mutiple nucleopolyhedrovirus TaxID=1592576 RepID=A0A0B4UL09_9ABAC|nr:hypothetical protein [Condylorrhiza vestigialis mutiple nucleopolyhedrovirus]AJD09269.1 hypothetical protein [Condylorrhiza vestigialis mutiple nucleopolyhedrovirus]